MDTLLANDNSQKIRIVPKTPALSLLSLLLNRGMNESNQSIVHPSMVHGLSMDALVQQGSVSIDT